MVGIRFRLQGFYVEFSPTVGGLDRKGQSLWSSNDTISLHLLNFPLFPHVKYIRVIKTLFLPWWLFHHCRTNTSFSFLLKATSTTCSLDLLSTWKPPCCRLWCSFIDLRDWFVYMINIQPSFRADLNKTDWIPCRTAEVTSVKLPHRVRSLTEKKLNNPLIHFKYHRTASNPHSNIIKHDSQKNPPNIKTERNPTAALQPQESKNTLN